MISQSNQSNHLFSVLMTGLFVLGIALRGVMLLTEPSQKFSQHEIRALATFPEWPITGRLWARLPAELDDYVSDHVGFREPLFRAHSRLALALGFVPVKGVVFGQEGWLFRTGTLVSYRKESPFTPEELQSVYQTYQDKQAWLAERGIPYLLVIVPVKASIYPEHVPASVLQVGEKSRLDQLVDYASRRGDLHLVDLRAELIAAKANARLYYKTDTHWTLPGGNVAQEKILAEVQRVLPSIRPRLFGPETFRTRPWSWAGGSIADGMMLKDLLREPELAEFASPYDICGASETARLSFLHRPTCQSLIPGCVRLGVPNRFGLEHRRLSDGNLCPSGDAFQLVCSESQTRHTALIFRDSYFQGIQSYVSSYFERSVFIWRSADRARLKYFVDRLNPDVVIEQRVEHTLYRAALLGRAASHQRSRGRSIEMEQLD